MSTAATQDRPAPPAAPKPKAEAPKVKARPGLAVYYWKPDGDEGMRPVPGVLVSRMATSGNWNLTAILLGDIAGHRDVPFSEVPKLFHWTVQTVPIPGE